jgi:hypothetical protein
MLPRNSISQVNMSGFAHSYKASRIPNARTIQPAPTSCDWSSEVVGYSGMIGEDESGTLLYLRQFCVP